MLLILWHSFLAPIHPLGGVETPVDIHWMTVNTSDHNKYSGRGEELPTPKWHQHLFVQLFPASPTHAASHPPTSTAFNQYQLVSVNLSLKINQMMHLNSFPVQYKIKEQNLLWIPVQWSHAYCLLWNKALFSKLISSEKVKFDHQFDFIWKNKFIF